MLRQKYLFRNKVWTFLKTMMRVFVCEIDFWCLKIEVFDGRGQKQKLHFQQDYCIFFKMLRLSCLNHLLLSQGKKPLPWWWGARVFVHKMHFGICVTSHLPVRTDLSYAPYTKLGQYIRPFFAVYLFWVGIRPLLYDKRASVSEYRPFTAVKRPYDVIFWQSGSNPISVCT